MDGTTARREQLKASVTSEFKRAFRRVANRRVMTESELLRELAEREVAADDAKKQTRNAI